MGLIINELVTNATKHAFPGRRSGRIRVGLEGLEEQQMQLSVEDDGAGFDDSHRSGVGQDLVRALSHDLGGEPNVKSTRSGSIFSLRFPYLEPTLHQIRSCRKSPLCDNHSNLAHRVPCNCSPTPEAPVRQPGKLT
jgi:signal transduction histidine kinase